MTQEEKQLLLADLSARLPYGVKGIITYNGDKDIFTIKGIFNILFLSDTECCHVEDFKPYLRSMSSMTEEERLELLEVVVGKDAIKYFQVLIDGSIDNTDAEHQDLQNFTMHWVNFDGINTASYLDWLNAHHFDYRGLIEKNLAIAVTEENNLYK